MQKYYDLTRRYIPLVKILGSCLHKPVAENLYPVMYHKKDREWYICIIGTHLATWCEKCGYVPVYNIKEDIDYKITLV